jgi:hypothetical protein
VVGEGGGESPPPPEVKGTHFRGQKNRVRVGEYYFKESTTILSVFLKDQSSDRLSTALTRILIKKELDSSNI